MSTGHLPNGFSDLPSWTTDDGAELRTAEDVMYPADSGIGRSLIVQLPPPSRTQCSDQNGMYKDFFQHCSTETSPEESGFGYQLPSPLEDGDILDPTLLEKERRREQNRIAQRAFRERKETRLKQLEKRIAELKTEQRCLERRYNDLRTAHLRLQSGLKILLDASGTFDGRNSELLDFAKDFDE